MLARGLSPAHSSMRTSTLPARRPSRFVVVWCLRAGSDVTSLGFRRAMVSPSVSSISAGR